jgi:molecular chaperone DnaK
MAKVAVDFGTCNTVIARVSDTTGETDTLAIPGITTTMRYRLGRDGQTVTVHVAPSLIHYAETETLIGDQVCARGLAEHRDTHRWFKRRIGQGITQKKKTAQGHKSAQEAGQEFLTLLLRYAGDRLDLANDEFTFTAPVEAFEYYENWLQQTCAAIGLRRVQLLDEPTACIFGYLGTTRKEERFLVFDFGGGTLDVSVVRIDPDPAADVKAVPLGQAGCDLGGMDIDRWLADDFCARHRLDDAGKREFEALILRRAEAVKIALSDPRETDATLEILDDRGAAPRLLRTDYDRGCPACANGGGDTCLGCLLAKQQFVPRIRETVDRALENAAVKASVRKSDIARIVVTGGTSLLPCVWQLLRELFPDRVDYTRPFDAVVRGACRGVVAPILQHDYALESYQREKGRYEFKPLFPIGAEYPIPAVDAKRLYCKGSYDGQTRVGIRVFEVSRMKRANLQEALVDRDGRFTAETKVQTEHQHICLNAEAPTFILADPPVNLARDGKRFLTSFTIDGNRRLLVTAEDLLTGQTLMKEHPVVRL